MLFSDNQTKHFYALNAATDGSTGVLYAVKTLANSDNIRVLLYKDATSKTAGEAMATTDVISRKLIKRAKVNEVKPTYFRTWTVAAPSTVTAGTTYHIYFYLDNMMGFGMQDRWDIVAAYTAKSGDTVATVMTALKNTLDSKLNGAGPIKNDFTVTSGSSNSIIVAENPNGPAFKGGITALDLRMHTTPYMYNVTMSTFDGTSAWGNQKEIHGVEAAANGTYISAATKVLAMELYFLRNRGDLYDLSKDFYTSILNETNTNTNATSYYTVDIDYAFSDTQGYTYHSDKQLSIAVPGAASGTASKPATDLMEAIVGQTIDTLDARVTALEG